MIPSQRTAWTIYPRVNMCRGSRRVRVCGSELSGGPILGVVYLQKFLKAHVFCFAGEHTATGTTHPGTQTVWE
jgi:hypothetical protein